MLLWVVREQAHEQRHRGSESREYINELTLGAYTTVALARAAVAMRLRNLFAGGDCFTAPCPDGLYVTQRWADDGTGTMSLWVKPPERQPASHSGYNYYEPDSFHLTLAIETQEVNMPPLMDRRPDFWEALEDAAGYIRPAPPPPPPLTAEQQAQQQARQEAAMADF
jgi:hypothetical protein